MVDAGHRADRRRRRPVQPRSRPRRGSPSRGRPSRGPSGTRTAEARDVGLDLVPGRRSGPGRRRRASRSTRHAGREHRRRRRGGSRARSPRRSPGRGGRGRGPGSGRRTRRSRSGPRSASARRRGTGRKTRPSAPGGVAAASSSSRSVVDAAADDRRRGTSRAPGRSPPSPPRRCSRPASGAGVTNAPGDLDRLVPVHAEAAGRAARVVGVARLEQAGAEVARERVVRAARDRDAGPQPERVGGGRRSATPTTPPIARSGGRRSIAQAGRRGDDAPGPGRPGRARAARRPRRSAGTPATPRSSRYQRVRRGDRRARGAPATGRPAAGPSAQPRIAGRGGQLVGLGGGPRVEEGDRRAGRLAAAVDGGERRAVAVDADRRRCRPGSGLAAGARTAPTTADHHAPGSCSAQPGPCPTSSP